MDKEKKIEELQSNLRALLDGLNAKSLSFEWYYFFEDHIENIDFSFAYDFLSERSLEGMSETDREALIFIFKNASSILHKC